MPFIIRYVLDQYETQKIYDKAILENDGTLESVRAQCETQEMCCKAGDNYVHALKVVT